MSTKLKCMENFGNPLELTFHLMKPCSVFSNQDFYVEILETPFPLVEKCRNFDQFDKENIIF